MLTHILGLDFCDLPIDIECHPKFTHITIIQTILS